MKQKGLHKNRDWLLRKKRPRRKQLTRQPKKQEFKHWQKRKLMKKLPQKQRPKRRLLNKNESKKKRGLQRRKDWQRRQG